MAGRPKKTTTTSTATDTTDTIATTAEASTSDSAVSREEYEILKTANEQLMAQMIALMEKISGMETATKAETVSTQESVADTSTEESFVEINTMKPIKIISLSDGGVNLKSTMGVHRLERFGDFLILQYSTVQEIISMNRTFIEDGTVYILDKDVIRNNYLEDTYKKFLTYETITNILTFPKDKIVEMVSNTTATIQDSIISMLVKKINNGEYVDMNKVAAIGNACNPTCDIMALAMKFREQQ